MWFTEQRDEQIHTHSNIQNTETGNKQRFIYIFLIVISYQIVSYQKYIFIFEFQKLSLQKNQLVFIRENNRIAKSLKQVDDISFYWYVFCFIFKPKKFEYYNGLYNQKMFIYLLFVKIYDHFEFQRILTEWKQ